MSKWIKNDSGSDKTWVGQLLIDQEYYQIQKSEEFAWSNNSQLLSDIGAGIAVVAKDDSGNTNILDVNEAINYLKDNIPKEVITQFEQDTVTLKLTYMEAAVDSNGDAVAEIKIPGVMANGNGRVVHAGEAFFDTQHSKDKIVCVEVFDKDNVLGYGAGAVIKTYHDEEAPTVNQGWVIPKHLGHVKVKALVGNGFIPAQLWLRVKGVKGESQTTGTMFVNLQWGKKNA